MNLLIIGAPGTGKGTMSNLITSELLFTWLNF